MGRRNAGNEIWHITQIPPQYGKRKMDSDVVLEFPTHIVEFLSTLIRKMNVFHYIFLLTIVALEIHWYLLTMT